MVNFIVIRSSSQQATRVDPSGGLCRFLLPASQFIHVYFEYILFSYLFTHSIMHKLLCHHSCKTHRWIKPYKMFFHMIHAPWRQSVRITLSRPTHHHLPSLAISLSSLSRLAFSCITFFLCNILRSFMLISEILELVSWEVFETGLVDPPEEAVRVVLALADRRADSRILSCN